MGSKYFNRIILGLSLTVGFIFVGYLLAVSEASDSFTVGSVTTFSRGYVGGDFSLGSILLLMVPFTIIYTIYSYIEYQNYKKRMSVDPSYHPLKPYSKAYFEEK